jgi:hypothetical protein
MTNAQQLLPSLVIREFDIRHYVLMCFRFDFRALLLAGRAPWFDFFKPRWGLAITYSPVCHNNLHQVLSHHRSKYHAAKCDGRRTTLSLPASQRMKKPPPRAAHSNPFERATASR